MNSILSKMLCLQVRIIIRKCSQLKKSINSLEQNVYKIKRLDYADGMFSQAMLRVKSKKSRMKSGLILLEGRRLIEEALKVGIKPEMVFYTQRDDLDKLLNLNSDMKFYKVPYKDVLLWSDLTTSPGILAFCKKPEMIERRENYIPVTVVCDQVREPGNLGAIIRNAAGAGVEKVVLMKGCVDLWETKVLRGAMGAHFHLPIASGVTWEDFSQYIKPNTNFLLAVHQPSSIRNKLNCYPYYEINYKEISDVVIVVGGETEGLSEHVFLKAKELNGKAINIPLSNNIESLNCVSALSIVLFEIKRQLNL